MRFACFWAACFLRDCKGLLVFQRTGEAQPLQPSSNVNRSSTHRPVCRGQETYNDAGVVKEYLDFHFGPDSTHSGHPAANAALVLDVVKNLRIPHGRALEVGCGPGRASLELSRVFDHVDGVDTSQAFVDIANRLVSEDGLDWQAVEQDGLDGHVVKRSVSLSSMIGVNGSRVSISNTNACGLPKSMTGFDAICSFNLLDRLEHPKQFLLDVAARLNQDGLLAISTPYEWNVELTPMSEQLDSIELKEFLLAHGLREASPSVWFSFSVFPNLDPPTIPAQMTFWQRGSSHI